MNSLSNECLPQIDLVYIITLQNIRSIGRKTIWSILKILGEKKNNYDLNNYYKYNMNIGALNGLLKDYEVDLKKINKNYKPPNEDDLNKAYSDAQIIIEYSKNNDIDIFPYYHTNYPKRLLEIADPPIIIYTKGNYECLNNDNSIAIIGTRQPTEYGAKQAHRMGELLATKHYIVTSGLALGCDTKAHEGCIRRDGKTVAILAHGLGVNIYPSENKKLAEDIILKGGCLVSEYPPKDKISKRTLVERDRLQSGLSKAVVVIETDVVGGSMHTVSFCIKQKRILACIRHPKDFLNYPQTKGNQKIIDETSNYGAHIIDCENNESIHSFLNKVNLYHFMQKEVNNSQKNTIKQRQKDKNGNNKKLFDF